jgi:5,10-methylene-tetrahydrofolate dehydrogenase/methenyl tetrahydrofolate cyclohydrolase
LCGDIDLEAFKDTGCEITPVPKGVGLLTTAQLVLNVIAAYYLQN